MMLDGHFPPPCNPDVISKHEGKIQKIRATFPSLEWDIRYQGKIISCVALSKTPTQVMPYRSTIVIQVSIYLNYEDSALAIVTFGTMPQIQLFCTPTYNAGLTLAQVLDELKQWFEQMAEVFARVVR